MRYLNLTRNIFYILFPAKRKRSIGKSFLAVATFISKKLVHSLAEHFQTPMNKVNNLIIIWKFPKDARDGHIWPVGRVLETPSLKPAEISLQLMRDDGEFEKDFSANLRSVFREENLGHFLWASTKPVVP